MLQTLRHLTARGALCLALLAGTVFADSPPAGDPVAIPNSIETVNVPSLLAALGDRLGRYANTRSAMLMGWQGDAMLVSTRFAETSQVHRVNAPLGYRQQLTFIDEPVSGVAVPPNGAQETAILSWDVGGSEFTQLFHFNLNTGEATMLSDGESLYGGVIYSPDGSAITYVTTQRNGTNWDVHVMDIEGEDRAVLTTDEGFWHPLSWSPDGARLIVRNRVSVNLASIYELEVASGELTPLLGHDEEMSIGGAAYDGHGGVVFTSDSGGEFLTLRRLDLASGEITVLTDDVPWNVDAFVVSAQLDKLAYVINEGGVSRVALRALPGYEPLPVPEFPRGVLLSMLFSPDGSHLGATITSAVSPADVYVADLAKQTITRWTQSEVGGLDTSRFVDTDLIDYETFDGRRIPAFVYKPSLDGPHPVVVLIHGGPEAQYRPYFSTLTQSLIQEMGVAVVAPNVRGSNGYGKSYLKLDNGKLREDSVKDIGALLDWIETQDDLDADRVAVYGGSYGGYMVLASMVHFGDRLAAAVESVGISSFVTFLENTQSYRQDMRRVEYGDERDPNMRAFLETISPLNHVDKMTTPVLISQGANDPRVPASESDQILQALQAKGVPVWYVLAKDEGHGFRKKGNRDYDHVAKFAFLERYLKQE